MEYSRFYKLFLPAAAAGADKIHFDLFNATGSTQNVFVHSVVPVMSGAVAVTGLVAVDLFLTRTTAVGTTGTAAVAEGATLTTPAITAMDHSQRINSLITARAAPGGGATGGAILSARSVYSEEANAGTYAQITDMVRGLYVDVAPLLVPEGSGIRVIQSSVASVGNVGFDVIFRTVAK
jgi:hypothetical protein